MSSDNRGINNDVDPRNHASRIYPGLHLGSVDALKALARAPPADQAGWCVVTLLSHQEKQGVPLPRHVDAHLLFVLDDVPSTDLSKHFEQCHAFIESAMARGKRVLVHCLAGISRSPTIVCAHLMLKCGMNAIGALDTVRRARPFVDPNPAFCCQLMALSLALAPPTLPRGIYHQTGSAV
ncbi:Protein tyrosine phosphatase [Pandoravirus quercus]|uniref:Protein tyrosine phosphatase n=1 Tax=Pandoravirus quercus TaxID=2107709 RepID=A0A2U7U984_9VIRU|nr:Protein tyrosine phosphatase [Pandoravirus quercus]AVK74952.1 Protein tyrosine phosphatase [Pandoravirus quercus]